MRLELGGDIVLGCAQEGHNVYHDVMDDPHQAREMGPGLSWTEAGFWGRQGPCLLWPPIRVVPPDYGGQLCSLPVPVQTPAVLPSALLSWPGPHTQCMAFFWLLAQRMAICGLPMGLLSLGMECLPQRGTG